MEPLKDYLPTPASLAAGMGNCSTQPQGLDDITLERGRRLARRLLGALAPLLPVVATATRDPAGAAAWVEAWGRHIAQAGLGGEDIARALRRLGELDRSRPFDWPAFMALAEPSREETRAAWERALAAAGNAGDVPAWHTLDVLTFTTWRQMSARADLRNPTPAELDLWHRTYCQLSRRPGEWQTPPPPPAALVEHRRDHSGGLAALRAWKTKDEAALRQ